MITAGLGGIAAGAVGGDPAAGDTGDGGGDGAGGVPGPDGLVFRGRVGGGIGAVAEKELLAAYADPALLTPGYRTGMLLCAGLLAASAVVAVVGVRARLGAPDDAPEPA